MTELEQLKAQRKELDKKIRELEHPKYEIDGARLFLNTYSGGRPDEWAVYLEEINNTTDKPWAYKKIISARSKAEAIEYLENQIKILQALVDEVN
jgi:prefoldin subunit 5